MKSEFVLTICSGVERAAAAGAANANGEQLNADMPFRVGSISKSFIGAMMPALFIGGTAGLSVHALFPDIRIALAFSCMLVALPGVSIGAPFSMVFLAALTVGVGAVETAPAAVAVLTAYTLTSGLGWFGIPVDKTVVDIDEVSVQSELFDVGGDVATDDS